MRNNQNNTYNNGFFNTYATRLRVDRLKLFNFYQFQKDFAVDASSIFTLKSLHLTMCTFSRRTYFFFLLLYTKSNVWPIINTYLV